MSFSSGMAFNGGTSTISCPSITPGTTTGISVGNAELTINGNVIGAATTSTLIQTSASGSRLRMNGKVTATSGGLPVIGIAGGSNIITGDIVHSGTGIGVSHVSGNVTILNSQITTSGAGVPINKFVAGGVIRLRDVYLFSVTAANTITGPAGTNVIALGCYSNNPLGANVTVIGDMKIGDTVAATANQVPVSLANGAWNWGSLPSATTLAGNVVIVDAVNGNDSTGLVGDLTKPFLTLLAAQAAASSGQTILVYPGAYSSVTLGKSGVNWYFMPGANVTFTGNAFTAIVTMTYVVAGYGFFSGNGRLASITGGGCNIFIECQGANTSNGFGVTQVNSRLIISVRNNWTIANGITSEVTSSNALAQIKANSITVSSGGAVPFTITNGGMDIETPSFTYTGAATSMFLHNGGVLKLLRCQIVAASVTGPVIERTVVGTGQVELVNVSITGNPSYNSIGGAQPLSVISDGSRVSMAIAANVVVSGNLQTGFSGLTVGQVPTANADGTWTWA